MYKYKWGSLDKKAGFRKVIVRCFNHETLPTLGTTLDDLRGTDRIGLSKTSKKIAQFRAGDRWKSIPLYTNLMHTGEDVK